jgi:hypothetical protein
MRKKTCEHCSAKFLTNEKEDRHVDSFLCKRCVNYWHKFFAKNQKRLEEKYPNEHNPTWLVWKGELKNDIVPEKVQFT